MSLDHQLIDVGGVQGVEGLQGEVVQDEQVDAHELAHLGVVAVVEAKARRRFKSTSARQNVTV